VLTACSSGPGHESASASNAWTAHGIDAVSRPVTGAGVTAVTALAGDALQTVVSATSTGRRLWTRPATMAGRPAEMGVEPPAVVGPRGRAVVITVEPEKTPHLVARDATTGALRWSIPETSTFGPAACGPDVCLSQDTTRSDAAFTVLDPATGRERWRMSGIGEAEWSDPQRVVVLRMAAHPVLESHELQSGKTDWSYPVEKAVGTGVNLAGGWTFGALGLDTLVGYIGPYRTRQGAQPSSYGFFGLDLADGTLRWSRPGLLRVYPSAAPAVALITREVTRRGDYGGFVQLDPRTGQTVARLPADRTPGSTWWLAFPPDLSTIGFLSQGRRGVAYELSRAQRVSTDDLRAWSFCTITPSPLPIRDRQGFYSVASLCEYDLRTGRKIANPGPPPGWYTGATDGWRIWRDDTGALHGIHDAQGTLPGMYG
jgi:hypothetical protein